ncbi:MAG: hypothetical protein ACRCYU_13150 [Nocardioides sp.]
MLRFAFTVGAVWGVIECRLALPVCGSPGGDVVGRGGRGQAGGGIAARFAKTATIAAAHGQVAGIREVVFSGSSPAPAIVDGMSFTLEIWPVLRDVALVSLTVGILVVLIAFTIDRWLGPACRPGP